MGQPISLSLMGFKCGMTRVYSENGTAIPVTVVQLVENRVVQIKTRDLHGYDAVQLTAGAVKSSTLSKAEQNHFAKSEVIAGSDLWECRLDAAEVSQVSAGASFGAQYFKVGDFVDVSGQSIGKGFAGTIKRWNFSSLDETHGNSLTTRKPGSIGQRQSPGRVFKGKKMSGRMGGYKRTVMSLPVVKVDEEKGILMIRGSVPGCRNGKVFVRFAVKKESA